MIGTLLVAGLFLNYSFFLEGISADRKCPGNARLFQKTCYYFSDDEFNFLEAEFECHDLGGHLAKDNTSEVHLFLTTAAKEEGRDHYWIGATDFIHDTHWKWVADGNDVGTSGFSAWATGQPDGTGPTTNCMGVYIHNGIMDWRDYRCDAHDFPYICEIPAYEDSLHLEAITSGGCPTGWAELKEDCVYVSDEAKTFLESEIECREQGGYLASDDTPEKHQFLTKLVEVATGQRNEIFWIGGTDFINPGEWRWSETEHPLGAYTHWQIGQPTLERDTNCMAMHWAGKELVWFNDECEDNDYYYICEKENPSYSVQPTTSTTSLGTIIG